MKLLSLDTSTQALSLAVLENDKILAYRNSKLGRALSASLMTEVEKILGKAGMALPEMDGIVVGLGPGGFTSLRVGLSSVKAMAMALRKPVVGISSLDALAYGVKAAGRICVLTDARRNLVYSCVYEKKIDGALHKINTYQLTSLEHALEDLDPKTYLTGDALGVYAKDIKRKGFKNLAEEKLWQPQAKALAKMGVLKFVSREYDDINTLVPLYLYPEDCQVRK